MTQVKRHKPPPEKIDPEYTRLWKVVQGAVIDTFNAHPEYLTDKGKKRIAASLSKRAVGAVLSFVRETRGRASD